MTLPLSRIFSDGLVVDNTVHRVGNGLFTANFSKPIEVVDGQREKSLRRAWSFLLRTSAMLKDRLQVDPSSALVFLRSGNPDYEHNTQDDFVHIESGTEHTEFSFTTGNLIGCVSGDFEGYPYTLRISSRFGDEFVKFIIADADGFLELPNFGGVHDSGSYEWLLVYLWLIKLKAAFRLGLPKSYESRTEVLIRVRGRIDPVDYSLNHKRARYSCTFREHSYDNETTRLIAHTLQHLDSHSFIRESHTLNNTFQIATNGKRSVLRDLLATKPVRNPYYADYNPVITLSKQILRSRFSEFSGGTKTSAFFFDVSMLFEYFIRKLLKRSGVTFHDKHARRLQVPCGRGNGAKRSLIPDLVFDVGDETYVFDVKYKSYNFSEGASREDVFQMHTYLGQLSNEHEVGGCGLIYPIRESRWEQFGLSSTEGLVSDVIVQNRRPVPFHIAFLKVPERGASTDEDWPVHFRARFQKETGRFIERLLSRISAHAKTRNFSSNNRV